MLEKMKEIIAEQLSTDADPGRGAYRSEHSWRCDRLS